jgi:hypothetical protein
MQYARTIGGLANLPQIWALLSQPSFWSFLSPVLAKCQSTSTLLIRLSRISSAVGSAWGDSRGAGSHISFPMIKNRSCSWLDGSSRHPTPPTRQFFRSTFYKRRVIVLIWIPIWVDVCSVPRNSTAKMRTYNSRQEDNDHYFLYSNAAISSRCVTIRLAVHKGVFYHRGAHDVTSRKYAISS